MSSASMTFGRPARLTVPRGALWFGNAAAALIAGIRRLDIWLLSLNSREPRTASEVMAYAREIENSDPGLAADLRSAALRSMGERDR